MSMIKHHFWDTKKQTRTFERRLLLDRLGRVETQELGELAAILSVLVNTKFQILAKSLVKLVEVVLVLGDLREEVQTFLDNVLTDNLENLVLLKSLTGDVEGQILGIDDTLDKVKVLGNKILTIVHDEDTADVEFDVVTLLLGLEKIERSTAKNESRTYVANQSLTAWERRGWP